jgi:hypothetical protein
MRSHRAAWAAIVLCLATSDLFAQKQLALLATVTTVSGSDASIAPKDVEVTENGKPLAIAKVELLPRVPKLQVLIDNGSGNQASALGELRNGLKAFLGQLPPNLEVTLITTAPQGRTLQAATTDRAKLLAAIDRIAPDAGTGRFVESFLEAMERVDKDKDEAAAYAILNVGTTSGDLTFRENDVKKISEKVVRRHPVVYTVLLNTMTSASLGGAQIELGKQLADMTGGRFEVIALTNRLATLLPELAVTITKLLGAKQLRVTADRTAVGELGQVGINIAGLNVLQLTLDTARTK